PGRGEGGDGVAHAPQEGRGQDEAVVQTGEGLPAASSGGGPGGCVSGGRTADPRRLGEGSGGRQSVRGPPPACHAGFGRPPLSSRGPHITGGVTVSLQQ